MVPVNSMVQRIPIISQKQMVFIISIEQMVPINSVEQRISNCFTEADGSRYYCYLMEEMVPIFHWSR